MNHLPANARTALAVLGLLAAGACESDVRLEGELPGDGGPADDAGADRPDARDVPEASHSWVVRLGEVGWQDYLYDVSAEPDGTVVALGSSAVGEAWIVRLDADGRVLGQYLVDGVQCRGPGGLTRTAAGELLLVGTTNDWGAGGMDLWFGVLEGDRLGRQWTFGTGGEDTAPRVRGTRDGGLVLAASTELSPGDPQLLVARLAADGTPAWQQVFAHDDAAEQWAGRRIAEGPDGRVYVASTLRAGGDGWDDVRLLALESDGTLRWERALGDTYHDGAIALEVDARGLWLTGQTDHSAFRNCAGWLAQLDFDGNVVRQTGYNGGGCDAIAGLVAAGEGWTLAGNLQTPVVIGESTYRTWLLEVDAAGAVRRELTVGVDERQYPHALAAAGPDLVVVGVVEPNAAGEDNDAFVARVNAELAPPAGCDAFAATANEAAATAVPLRDLSSRPTTAAAVQGPAAATLRAANVPVTRVCGP
jgi:hypothetical protein